MERKGLTPQINIGTITPNQAITIGNNSTTLQLTASTLSPLSIKVNAQSIDIPYNNVNKSLLEVFVLVQYHQTGQG